MALSAQFSNGPFRALVILLVALVLLGQSRAASARVASEAALGADLASILLTPEDLAGAGLPNLGFGGGRFLSAEDLAARAVWPTGAGPELDAHSQQLDDAGFEQAYIAAATTRRDSGDLGAITDVEWEVAAFATESGATTGFASIPDTLVTGEQTSESGSGPIGDDSRITRIAARDPGSGYETAELVLGFRAGPLVAHVLVRAPVDAPPAVSQIEHLGSMLADKMDAAAGPAAPGLSRCACYAAPRDAMTVQWAAYQRLAGADLRSAFDIGKDATAPASSFDDARDVFSYRTEVAASDSDDTLSFMTTLLRFPDADAAAAWLDARPAKLGAEPGAADLTVGPGIQAGDESASVTMTASPGADPIHRVIVDVRDGAVVAEVTLSRVYQAPAEAVAHELAGRQADLLTDGARAILVAG